MTALGLWNRLRDLLTSRPSLGKFFYDHIKRSKKQRVRNNQPAIDVFAQSSRAEIEARCQLSHAAHLRSGACQHMPSDRFVSHCANCRVPRYRGQVSSCRRATTVR